MITARHLGDSIDDVLKIVQKVPQYLPTVLSIVEDPALPQVVDRIKILRALEQQDRTTAKAAGLPQPGPPGPVGIGLHRLIKPLDLYIEARKNPKKVYGMLGLGLAAFAGLFLGAGITIGHRKLRRMQAAKT